MLGLSERPIGSIAVVASIPQNTWVPSQVKIFTSQGPQPMLFMSCPRRAGLPSLAAESPVSTFCRLRFVVPLPYKPGNKFSSERSFASSIANKTSWEQAVLSRHSQVCRLPVLQVASDGQQSLATYNYHHEGAFRLLRPLSLEWVCLLWSNCCTLYQAGTDFKRCRNVQNRRFFIVPSKKFEQLARLRMSLWASWTVCYLTRHKQVSQGLKGVACDERKFSDYKFWAYIQIFKSSVAEVLCFKPVHLEK